MLAVMPLCNAYMLFQDALVDMTALGEEIHENFPKSYKAHKGIIKAARNLARKLKENNLLRKAFTGQVCVLLKESFRSANSREL